MTQRVVVQRGKRNENHTKRSSPTTWVGDTITTIGTRAYYAACKYENEVYRVWDAVLLNSEVEPLPIGRIVAMWEQAKKKWLTINWFYRATDLQRSIEERQKSILEAKDSPDDEGTTRNTGKKGKAPPSRKKPDPTEEDTLKDTLEYISKIKPQEILVSSHKDDNYPSTLFQKITVKHADEIPNMEDYLKRDKKIFLYYKKHVDLASFKLTNAMSSHPTPLEAIGKKDLYSLHNRRRRKRQQSEPLQEHPDGVTTTLGKHLHDH